MFIGLLTSAWFLVIVLTVMLLRARKNQKDLVSSYQDLETAIQLEDAKRRQAHKATISSLQGILINLQYLVRGTDEATEQESRDLCEEQDKEYEMPEPALGAAEFAVEIACLHRVLSAIYYDLDDERILDPDMEFYQKWVTRLQRHVTSWNERRQAHTQLEDIMARLHAILEKIQCVHGVTEWCPSLLESWEVESPQDLFNSVVVLRDFLERKLASKTANLAKLTQFTIEVESLERRYSRLHDPLSRFVARLAPYDTDHLDLDHFLSWN